MVKKLENLPNVVPRTVRKKTKTGIKTYQYFYYERDLGKTRIKLPNPDDPDFLKRYQEARSGKAQRPSIPRFTFRHLIDHYKTKSRTLQNKRKRKGWNDLGPRTKKDYGKCLDYIEANAGDKDFRKTTRLDVVAAMDANDHRKKFGNDLKQVFSILFEHARSQGWMEVNPAQGVQKRHTGDGYVSWPPDVQAAFWKAADYNMRLIMILYIDSAQRGGDILDYKWSDRTEHGLNVVQNKTGTEVFVPYTDWLRGALDTEYQRQREAKIVQLPPNDYILQGRYGGKLSYNALSDRFTRTRKAAKIDTKYKLHGLRYTASEELAVAAGMAGASVTGHLSPEMFKKYAGKALRETQAIEAQEARNRTRPEREPLKPSLKPK